MRSILRNVQLVAGVLLLFARFCQPDRSVPVAVPARGMLAKAQAPADIRQLVVGACYDRHGCRAQYPWYAAGAPMNTMVQVHSTEGRKHFDHRVWDRSAVSEAAGAVGMVLQAGGMPPALVVMRRNCGPDLHPTQHTPHPLCTSALPTYRRS